MTIIQDFKKSLYNRISRRKFIAVLGALGIGVVLGMIYTSIRLRKSIHPLSKQPEKSRVYIVSANDREVGINNLLDSFSLLDFKDKSIILKPNFMHLIYQNFLELNSFNHLFKRMTVISTKYWQPLFKYLLRKNGSGFFSLSKDSWLMFRIR